MPTLILVRHGESTWNLEQRFTGWADVPLSETGRTQMALIGAILQRERFSVDAAICSELSRARSSMEIILSVLGIKTQSIEVRDWRLNERHYGALTGLSRANAEDEFGVETVSEWRRRYNVRPPILTGRYETTPTWRHPSLSQSILGESLDDVAVRVSRFADEILWPTLATHDTTLVVGHGNSIRALLSIIHAVPVSATADMEIRNGQTFIFDNNGCMDISYCRGFFPAQSTRSVIL